MTLVPETGEEMLECPYNKSHLISAARMQFHLVKCRKASGEETKTCPFNGQHHVRSLDFLNHCANCPNRSTVLNFLLKDGNEGSVIPAYKAPVLPAEVENWDDGEVETYDPNERCSTELVFRTLTGGTKSERKTFRFYERERYQTLANGPASTAPVGAPAAEAEAEDVLRIVEKKECFETSKSLRQPKARSETFVLPPEIMDKVGQGRGKALSKPIPSGIVNQGASTSGYTAPLPEYMIPCEKEMSFTVKKTKKKKSAPGQVTLINPVTHVGVKPVTHIDKPSTSKAAPWAPADASADAFANLDINDSVHTDDIWSGLPLRPIAHQEDGPIPRPDFNLDFPTLSQGRGRARHMNNVRQQGKKDKR